MVSPASTGLIQRTSSTPGEPSDAKPSKVKQVGLQSDVASPLAAGATEAEVLVTAEDGALTRFANSEIHQNVADVSVKVSLRFVRGRNFTADEIAADADVFIVSETLARQRPLRRRKPHRHGNRSRAAQNRTVTVVGRLE